MSKEPQVREVVPFKPGKRPSTARKLNIDFAGGTALEEALAGQQRAEATNHDSPPLPTTPHQTATLSNILTNQPVEEKPIAPTRDFNKRANSLERDAMPAGLFPGSTFKVYNALYLRSRGAVVPTRRVRASRRDLLGWTDIRNLKTIDNHIRYLMAKTLIVRHWELGSNEGSEYEIFLPEEVLPPVTTSHHQSPPVTTTQKTSSGYTQFLGSGGDSQTIENKTTSELPQTIIRLDKNIDDEAFAGFIEVLRQGTREVTGRDANVSDQQRFRELAELLMTELKIASARTTVSNVPAFLTEHLRRRLWKPDKQQSKQPRSQVPDTLDDSTLRPPERTLTAEQIKGCQDCGGTGFYYPEGYEGGVAKCRHLAVTPAAETPL